MHAMTSSLPAEKPAPSPPWGRALLGRLLAPWLRIKRDPAEPLSLLAADAPVVYVIERQGLSDGLILERACREAGLPSPLLPVSGTRRRRSMFALSQREGWLFGRDRQRAPREALKQLLLALETQPERDIQLLPVSIYVGRAPNRQSGWLRALLSENWVVVGRFRRLLAILLNGRDTIVHFSTPISLRAALDEVPGERPERLQRKLARVLRVHFRRVRTTVIGPDLSHRRTVVDSVLNAESVRAAIAATASRENIPYATAWRRAHKLMREIAADYSPPFVRALSFLLSIFCNML
jgi:glycerol-3-phosphate O-acyltransferase